MSSKAELNSSVGINSGDLQPEESETRRVEAAPKESSDMGPMSQPTHLRVRFEGTDRGSATVRLL